MNSLKAKQDLMKSIENFEKETNFMFDNASNNPVTGSDLKHLCEVINAVFSSIKNTIE